MEIKKVKAGSYYKLERALKLYLLPRRHLRQALVELGFLPPDAAELARFDFPVDVEWNVTVQYETYSPAEEEREPDVIFLGQDFFYEKVGDNKFYTLSSVEVNLREEVPIATLPPRERKDSDTAILTAGALNMFAAYIMTGKSHIVAVPHAKVATVGSNVLARYFKNREIRRVVLAFPKQYQQQQKQLASFLRKKGFKVEILPYEGKSPFEHYQLSITKMMEQAMEQLEHEEVYNPAREA